MKDLEKPLEETLRDLSTFHSQVTASKQFADDPDLILDSVTGLVDGAIDRVKRAIGDRDDSRDKIWAPLPETNDRIIRAPPPNAPTGKARPDLPTDRPKIATRFLSGRTMEAMPTTALEGRTEFQSKMQGAPLPGLVSGKPMSFYPVQPPIFVLPEPGARGDEDWLLQLLAPRRGR